MRADHFTGGTVSAAARPGENQPASLQLQHLAWAFFHTLPAQHTLVLVDARHFLRFGHF